MGSRFEIVIGLDGSEQHRDQVDPQLHDLPLYATRLAVHTTSTPYRSPHPARLVVGPESRREEVTLD
jgi:hypothetical protein